MSERTVSGVKDAQPRLDIWIEKTSENGYRPGLYCNQSTFSFIKSCLSPEKLNQLEKMYERKCGPLTNKNVDTEYGWEWACCPWPWEGKE